MDQTFYIKRTIGENDNYIFELIRNDAINEFISYVKQTNFPLMSKIIPSIFETNLLFLKKDKDIFNIGKDEITLLEYAAFLGSIQIFKYLYNLYQKPSSVWNYSAHGNNLNLIQFLEQKNPKLSSYNLSTIFPKSISCNHDEIAKYVLSKLVNNAKKSLNDKLMPLKHYNFLFINKNLINKSLFFELCKYDYLPIVEFHLKNSKIDINKFQFLINNYEYN